jgi:tripartite-type tricarboxylate transporter receptor subunit TctC
MNMFGLGAFNLSRHAAFLFAAALTIAPAAAQEYPARPITIICGYAAGTGGDVVDRYFADKLRALAGQPVLVENKVGAQTAVAAEFVSHAKPDGYTMLITAGNSTMAANPHLFKKLNYDPVKDFTPVTTIAQLPFLVTVTPKSPMNSMKDLIDFLKKKGDKATYAYPNSFSQAATAYFSKLVGVNPVGVAYKATPTALTDMNGGELDFIFMDATFGVQQEKQGQLKVLAVTTAERSPVAPEFPGMKEAGVPGFDLAAWWAVWLPPNTPAPVVKKLETWINQIDATDETRAFLLRIGAAPLPGDSQKLAKLVPAEIEKWGQIIKAANIQPE